MGCSPSKIQDGAPPVVHPVVKPGVETVNETAPAEATQRQSPPEDISTQFGNSKEENEAACKVQSVYRGHAARKRVEGLRTEMDSKVDQGPDEEGGKCAIPEDHPATEQPAANPDDSAAAVVQIFGEEGANAVAAAFFDGNAATDVEDPVICNAPEEGSGPADDEVPAQEDDAVGDPALKESAGEDAKAAESADLMDSGDTQVAEVDGAAGSAVDCATTEEAAAPEQTPVPSENSPAAEDNAAQVENADSDDAASPAAGQAIDDDASPEEAPVTEESPEPATAGTDLDAVASNDGPTPEAEVTSGVEASPEEVAEPSTSNQDTPPEDASSPSDDAPTAGDESGEAEAAGNTEDS